MSHDLCLSSLFEEFPLVGNPDAEDHGLGRVKVYSGNVAVGRGQVPRPAPACLALSCAAKAVCPEAPQAVLSLSHMVAVDRSDRQLKHISKPLRRQMNHMIDRTRWPVLLTYSDEGEGHNGFTYECSGWISTVRSKRPVYENTAGQRCSSYSNGRHGGRDLVFKGFTWIQRWENRVCEVGQAHAWMVKHGWQRVAVPGKRWANGRQAHTYVHVGAAAIAVPDERLDMLQLD